MWRQGGDPVGRLGDVLRGQRRGAFVDLGGGRVVALEAHVRELGAAAQARRQVGGAHARADQVGAQVERELLDEGLGCAVHIAARVGIVAGHRAQVDHQAAAALDHVRQHRAGHGHQALAVGGDHGFPVFQRHFVRRQGVQRQAGVVDQDVDRTPVRRQRSERRLDRGAAGHVQGEGQGGVAQFGGEFGDAFGAARGEHDAVAVAGEGARHFGAEAGRGAGDEYDHGSVLEASGPGNCSRNDHVFAGGPPVRPGLPGRQQFPCPKGGRSHTIWSPYVSRNWRNAAPAASGSMRGKVESHRGT